MTEFKLIIGPDPVFRKKSDPVEDFDDDTRNICSTLLDLLYNEHAVGVAAPMIGVLKRIIVVDLQEDGKRNPFSMINPVIVKKSDEMQTFEEASICFPGLFAKIIRPSSITVNYFDDTGSPSQMEAVGYLATVIQHEMDYLDGVLYFDHLSSVKRNMLLKKARKYKQQ